MRAIFISYRREDAEGQAGRLFDDLIGHFGEDTVFMDVAGIEPGRDFRRVIDEHVASCGVLLAIIGKSWIDAKDEAGQRRLDDPMDFVRLETASALKRDIPVVPVLVHGARMPRADQLPTDLAELAFRNGVELTHARWDSDVQVLIKALSPYVTSLHQGIGGTPETAAAPGRSAPKIDNGATSPPAEPAGGKNSRTIVALSLTAIVLAAGGYWTYRNAAEKAEPDRISEQEIAVTVKAKAADSDRLAQESARKKAEADRVAAEKARVAEADKMARDRANQKAEADKMAAEKAKLDAERRSLGRARAQAEAEAERIAAEKAAEADRAAAERARPVWGRAYNFPAPNGGLAVFRIMADGNPACASYNAASCLWGVTYDQLDLPRLRPLVCGDAHRARWGVTGYEDPKHWCSIARRLARTSN
jgi:hypothetical protein